MIEVRHTIRILGKKVSTGNPVGGIQKLSGFEDHLYDMLVAMMFRSNAGIEREEEDVHGRGQELGLWTEQIHFSNDTVQTRPKRS
jgi:hypothetical protein